MITFYNDKNQKLSKAVMKNCQDISFASLYKLLRNKDVKVNGKRINSDIPLKEKDFVEIYFIPRKHEKYGLIYHDENIIVINKKAGYTSESVFEDLISEYPTVRFIHRLDRNTSGIMIFGLNDGAETELKEGFKKRTFDKYYSATVKGVPDKDKDTVTAYLVKNPQDKQVKIYSEKIKGSCEIKTGYEVVSKTDETSELRVKLYTGKTHQIRAHLAFLGYPIVGDGKYGDNVFNRKTGVKTQILSATELVLHFNKGYLLYYLNDKSFKTEN